MSFPIELSLRIFNNLNLRTSKQIRLTSNLFNSLIKSTVYSNRVEIRSLDELTLKFNDVILIDLEECDNIQDFDTFERVQIDSYRNKLMIENLIRSKSIKKLVITRDVEPYSCSKLSEMTQLTGLSFKASAAIDDLDFIKPLINLRSLKMIDLNMYSSKSFNVLKELPKLEKLTTVRVPKKFEMKLLKKLAIPYGVSNDFLNYFPNLEDLSVATLESDVDYEKLKKLKSLKMYHDNIETFHLVCGLINLRRLNMPIFQSEFQIYKINRLINLKRLRISLIELKSITKLNLKKLKHLSIKVINYGDIKIDFIVNFPKLKTLKFIRCELNTKQVQRLLSQLEHLTSINFDYYRGSKKIDNLLEYISKIKSITTLSVNHSKMTKKGIEYICRMKQLRNLSIDCSQSVTTQILRKLSELPNLERLTTRELTDDKMEKLEGYEDLVINFKSKEY